MDPSAKTIVRHAYCAGIEKIAEAEDGSNDSLLSVDDFIRISRCSKFDSNNYRDHTA